jgi:hypothetical protein
VSRLRYQQYQKNVAIIILSLSLSLLKPRHSALRSTGRYSTQQIGTEPQPHAAPPAQSGSRAGPLLPDRQVPQQHLDALQLRQHATLQPGLAVHARKSFRRRPVPHYLCMEIHEWNIQGGVRLA